MSASMSSFDWNSAAIARLTELWAEGHSTAEIGRRMGTSKNSIVAKVHRIHLPPRPSPIKPPPVPRTPSGNVSMARQPITLPPMGQAVLPIATEPAGTRQCSFPLWGLERRPVHLFCQEMARVGKSYCPAHQAVCYHPAKAMSVPA